MIHNANDRLAINPGFVRFLRVSPGKRARLAPMTYRTPSKQEAHNG